ncbi:MAG: hypothetical protein COC01_09840 [Bacteroidetes bacterium]|nr:MAG: hypothetical protein COC01_09840 [Bacteroidota bacterium]
MNSTCSEKWKKYFLNPLLVIGFAMLTSDLYSIAIIKKVIATGADHSIALCDDGPVLTWGKNDKGQLGDSSLVDTNTAVQVYGLYNVVSIAAGYDHTMALKSDSTVWTWGDNFYGQLGDSSNITSIVPVQVYGLNDIIAIESYGQHSIALKSDGTVWTWGANWYGQLGDSTIVNSNVPVQVYGLSNITSIATGEYHSMALRNDSTLWVWGDDYYGQLGDSATGFNKEQIIPIKVDRISKVIAIAAGETHSMVLLANGEIWMWGDGGQGQLGNGKINSFVSVPNQVVGLSNVISISTGWRHSMAIRNDSTVWVWGDNSRNQLANNTKTLDSIPAQITSLQNIVAISSGGWHGLALKDDGTIFSWGYNLNGQLGDSGNTNQVTPVEVQISCNVTNKRIVDFSADKLVICKGETINFTNLSTGTIINNDWDFGDGGSSFATNPVYTYNVPGTYDVKLVGYYFDNPDSTAKTAYITVVDSLSLDLGNDTTTSNSITLDAGNTGASSYNWSTGSVNQTIVADSSGTYWVAVTNACGTLSDTINITVSATDSVWPGDVNYNGIANVWDILSIGVAYNTTGPPRDSIDTKWKGHDAQNWSPAFNNGTNYKHADCDGNGTIEVADALAISANYGKTHAKSSIQTNYKPGNPDLYFEILDNDIAPGTLVEISIQLGRDTVLANSVCGIAFSVLYNAELIDSGTVKMDFDTSWIGDIADTSLLTIEQDLFLQERIDIGLIRTNQKDTSGFGEIAKLRYVVTDNISGKTLIRDTIQLSFSNVVVISCNEDTVPVNTLINEIIIVDTTLAISEDPKWDTGINIYPNPVNHLLKIEHTGVQINFISLYDPFGKLLYMGSLINNTLDLSTYPSGLYYLLVHTSNSRIMSKISVIH